MSRLVPPKPSKPPPTADDVASKWSVQESPDRFVYGSKTGFIKTIPDRPGYVMLSDHDPEPGVSIPIQVLRDFLVSYDAEIHKSRGACGYCGNTFSVSVPNRQLICMTDGCPARSDYQGQVI